MTPRMALTRHSTITPHEMSLLLSILAWLSSIHLLVKVSQAFDTALLLGLLGVRNRSNDVYDLSEGRGSIDRKA